MRYPTEKGLKDTKNIKKYIEVWTEYCENLAMCNRWDFKQLIKTKNSEYENTAEFVVTITEKSDDDVIFEDTIKLPLMVVFQLLLLQNEAFEDGYNCAFDEIEKRVEEVKLEVQKLMKEEQDNTSTEAEDVKL
jgi:hypothetical protein